MKNLKDRPFLTSFYSILVLVALFFVPMLFLSCKPQISVRAGAGDEAMIFFSTGFSQSTAKTLQAISGLPENAPLFNKSDVLSLLKEAGAVNTSATLPNQNEITATGTLPNLSQNQLAKTGLLIKAEKSLTLTIGAKQIAAFYSLLNEDAKSYLDLMMIPALIGEKMTATEYNDLLAAMYGHTFAEEITNGKLTIQLSSPDGKRTKKETISLGELLTAQNELSWAIAW